MTDNQEQNIETGADLLTLVDEEGIEHEFEVVDSAEVDGERYMAMIPVFDDPQDALDDSGELVILKVVVDGDEEFLEAIEDEDEFDRVGDFFMDRLSDEFDFTDAE